MAPRFYEIQKFEVLLGISSCNFVLMQEERDISERYSALVNKAYSTLLHPLARGLYMLQLHGVNLDEETRQSDPQFLAEIMQANEELAEAQHPEDVKELDNANRSTVEKLIR